MSHVLTAIHTVLVKRKVLSLVDASVDSRVPSSKRDFQRIVERFEEIEALLPDAESKHGDSTAVRVWLDDLKTVASEADDAIEEFSYEVQLHPLEMPQRKRDKVRAIFSSNKHDSFINEIAQRIRNISSELGRIYKEAKKIGLVTTEITNEYDEFHPSKTNSATVGRVDDVLGVVHLLVNEGNEELSTVGLIGKPGSGKTILAQLVYNNEEVKKSFFIRLWVSVFMDFTEERLLNKIVQSLHEFNSPYKMRKKEEAIKLLQENMQKRKFLLVLDDVWIEDREKWERMRQCLLKVGGSRGSKILITTHNDNVISTVNASSSYRLGEALTERDSWYLFQLQALRNGGEVESLDEVECRRMLNRFGGMPLPIKALADLVFGNKDEELSSITLKFRNLPSTLQICFSYCCIFPKNKAIEKDSLIQCWMAQGFLQPPKGNLLKMEDVGNKYFNILVQNSLLTELTFDAYNNIKAGKMHDLAHGFVSDVLKNYFLNIGEGSIYGEASSAVHLSVSVGFSVELINMLDVVPLKLRTFYVKGVISEDVLSKFKYIHVLILDDYAIEELPASIVKLKNLRCIDIFWTRVRRLPDSITNLHQLETLRLASWSKLPRNLESLINLRHLYVKDCLMKRDYGPVEGIGSLVNLQTLSYFVVGQDEKCRIKELGPLEQLQGKLKILRLENVKNGEEAKQANLLAKKKIHCLMFEWGVERKEFNDEDVLEGLKPNPNLRGLTLVNYSGSKFATWMVSANNSLLLQNIVKIKLWNCTGCEMIPSLGHLRHLRMVEIFEMHNVTQIGDEFYGCSSLNDVSQTSNGYQVFPSLRKLHIHDMENLVEWASVPSDNSVAFPSLEQLTVNKCNKLTCLPDMSGLECLEELVITECKMLAYLPELNDLVSLQKLRLTDDHSLEWIPDVPECLCTLEIFRCRKLEELPRGLKWCRSLEAVQISDCPLFELDDLELINTLKILTVGDFDQDLDEFPFPRPQTIDYFVSLEKLGLYGWPTLTFLPKQIQYLPSLKELTIWDYGALETLPEWLGDLKSLETLNLCFCDHLKYFPSAEAMARLTNLMVVKIDNCLLLEERCARGSGPEWYKIAHIPNIIIDHL